MGTKRDATTASEYTRWHQYWNRQEAAVDNVLDALAIASQLGTYLALSILLRIFATLPVTTATGERSFSALKYINKNYLRCTMTDERLNVFCV